MARSSAHTIAKFLLTSGSTGIPKAVVNTHGMLAANQRAQELKFELLVQIAGDEPTAVTSFNYHQEHFASTYGLALRDGATAHTASGQSMPVL